MKTQSKLLLTLVIFLFIQKASALQPLLTFTFVAPCQPFAMITQVPNMPGCFSFSATNGGASEADEYYSWNFGDGSTGTGNPLVHCYPASPVGTTYTVTVAYNSKLACGSNTIAQQYQVVTGPSAPAGAKETNLKPAQLKLFPNPAKEQLNVIFPQDVSQLVLLDQTGRERQSVKVKGLLAYTFPLADLSEGLYVVRFVFADGSVNNLRFVKK